MKNSFKNILNRFRIFLADRKERRIRKKYSKFIKSEINPYSGYLAPNDSLDVDRLFIHCFAIGFKTITASEYHISGRLMNGEEFEFWNSNLWYSWLSNGFVGTKSNSWGRPSATSIGMSTIVGRPSASIQRMMRTYLLKLDNNFFFDNFLSIKNTDMKFSKKTYDCSQLNRDLKISYLMLPDVIKKFGKDNKWDNIELLDRYNKLPTR